MGNTDDVLNLFNRNYIIILNWLLNGRKVLKYYELNIVIINRSLGPQNVVCDQTYIKTVSVHIYFLILEGILEFDVN